MKTLRKYKYTAPVCLAVYLTVMLILMVLLPFLALNYFPRLMPKAEPVPYSGKIPDTVSLYHKSTDTTEIIPFETYIQGVVASEMPRTFNAEALKAQAVASRTYALGRINAGTTLCDTVHCQVYRSSPIAKKVIKAVEATEGQVLLYDGKLASSALYFSSSGGNTENAEDVFSNPIPYLISVSSAFEPNATHKKETVALRLSSFSKKIKKALPDESFGVIKKSNIKIKSHSAGGRVYRIKIGKAEISGTDVRSAVGLYSTRFSIAFKGKNIIFTTAGSGHGVGMSQYGANGLAEKGKDYRRILSHYYHGTCVSK